MNTSIYLSLRENKSFHTLIIKRKIGDLTYLAAIGYEGGGVFGEFYGKFSICKKSCGIKGLFSESTGSSFWETKLTALDFNDNNKMFVAEVINFDEFMSDEDEKIQNELLDELNKYIYYGYDEETGREHEYPEIKPLDLLTLKEFKNAPNNYHSINWNDECLEITNSNIWPLSLSFPHIIELYL